MMDRYSRLPPEEQRIVVVTLLCAAAALWLAVAWEEVMVLAALPDAPIVLYVKGRLPEGRVRIANRQRQGYLPRRRSNGKRTTVSGGFPKRPHPHCLVARQPSFG
jgi:hypothetical protein